MTMLDRADLSQNDFKAGGDNMFPRLFMNVYIKLMSIKKVFESQLWKCTGKKWGRDI